jgi:hypothetical protein
VFCFNSIPNRSICHTGIGAILRVVEKTVLRLPMKAASGFLRTGCLFVEVKRPTSYL